MDAHKAAVTTVSARVQQFDATKTPFRVYHGSTNSTRKSQHREDNAVDTSHMNHGGGSGVEGELGVGLGVG
ncbi:hypothetical protein B0I37DRAFT_359267, partial [Chaetomium sp. MPI-CAGE-AT-0009]